MYSAHVRCPVGREARDRLVRTIHKEIPRSAWKDDSGIYLEGRRQYKSNLTEKSNLIAHDRMEVDQVETTSIAGPVHRTLNTCRTTYAL